MVKNAEYKADLLATNDALLRSQQTSMRTRAEVLRQAFAPQILQKAVTLQENTYASMAEARFQAERVCCPGIQGELVKDLAHFLGEHQKRAAAIIRWYNKN
ncbi:hypothetical protein A2881_02175 [Candidatus Peribacteria bacterium RIFCSPHIGHO2_01_FULL_55_13]|nr:MAG: hypothetical protein A2881_02175 [Candidatus Peribacteria bacterium RIFCSPHIGHO2_01_FULL_55_13]OGJ64362.1 MAG: hypothetical protein A3F36_01065 [Candidatus Peribacteria bacterium RIFCSPHIGHO2_12_FULL_55_11]